MIFSLEKFALSMFIRTFVTREPAKPLNDAQMCGSFLFIGVWQQEFHLRRCTPRQATWYSCFNHED